MSIIDKIRWMGVPTGLTGTSTTVIKRGTVTISAGYVSVTVSHGFTSKPFVSDSIDAFVIFKKTVTATDITYEIDAPQTIDVNIDWMARL